MSKKPSKGSRGEAENTPQKSRGETEEYLDAEYVYCLLSMVDKEEAIEVLMMYRDGDYDGTARVALNEIEEDD